jgi:hypothetical protein
MKRRDKRIFKPKPMGDFFPVQMIKAPQRPMLHKIKIPANPASLYQVIVFGKTFLFQATDKRFARLVA